jgi:hypothetical protein
MMAGAPKRRKILEAASMWPPPSGMTAKQTLKLALAKLGYGPSVLLKDVTLPQGEPTATAAQRP